MDKFKSFLKCKIESKIFGNFILGKDGKNIVGNFKKRVRVENIKESDDKMTMEFDLIGVDASFANTLRRMMISGIYCYSYFFHQI